MASWRDASGPDPDPEELTDGVLTHIGFGEGFRDTPRPKDNSLMSMTLGRHQDAASAVRAAFGRGPRSGDQVRHFSVAGLRDAGYRVFSCPTRRNPDHVLVGAKSWPPPEPPPWLSSLVEE